MSKGVFAGILAAGRGERFATSGVRVPKPLVTVAGRSLVARAIDAFSDAGHEEVTLVTNDAVAPSIREHLAATPLPARATVFVKTTASTLETFGVLLQLAGESGVERFLFTTVDAVTPPRELARFGREALARGDDLALGVALAEPEDEGPLRVELDAGGRARLGRGPYATSGFYAGRTLDVAHRVRAALARGVPSLRSFLTDASGESVVRGIVLARAVDVDTPGDVITAERALASLQASENP
jgi:MurNAc alpha-1-phosphate uridylyltransferase